MSNVTSYITDMPSGERMGHQKKSILFIHPTLHAEYVCRQNGGLCTSLHYIIQYSKIGSITSALAAVQSLHRKSSVTIKMCDCHLNCAVFK